ncbi:SirB2 family protein [Thalassotalea maritima]|uniref:SirB2 family protein n=1 Tax=Thalassotalea maritima TaxID=3242416 RepID=UPI00352939BD
MLIFAHMLCVSLSVVLFSYRWLLVMWAPYHLEKKWLKILPHIIDTLLLTCGIALMLQRSLFPSTIDWLAEKLIAVVIYIAVGFYTLKFASTKRGKIFGYLGAMLTMLTIIYLALTKQSLMS